MPSQSAYNLVTFRPSTGRITPADTTFNQAGRVTMIEDATGWRSFKYGQLGEVTEETHTLAVINQDRPYSFTMHYAYDGFNRIKDIEYPDGELVSYSYDRGGQLYSVSSRKGFDSVSYINRIHYNAQGLRSYLEYGNGVATNYTYDSLMRLSSLYSRAEGDQTLQNISYSYDLVGNIVGISNTSNQTANGLGGFYNNTYTYDSLYRMTIAAGNGAVAQYKMEATYSPAGRMLTKGLHAESPILNISYGKSYSYHTGQPHTVREVTGGDEPYYLLWDANGNLNSYSAKDPQTLRRLCWTEENRLAAVADADFISHYVYDANGDRTIKLSAETMNMDINASGERFGRMKYYTIYPSPYIVVDHKGYTKHYYAGTERLCSRLGGGGLQDLHHYNGSDSVFRSKVDANHYTFKMDLVCAGASATVRDIDLEPLEFLQSLMADEQDIYWFHSDHLGSASWITDAGGQPIQHLQYLPYGETLLDQRNGGYHERYTFSGKEKDKETGYHYFGSRYYNSDLSLWISVDPMSDKYPSLTPYNYCVWNPMKFVDPNGEDFEKIIDHENKKIIICAQFYSIDATEAQQDFIQKSALAWNSSSFTVSLTGEGGVMEDYTVSFDINNGNGPTNYVTFLPNEVYDSRYSSHTESGGVADGHDISIRSTIYNNQVLAHEMGHCLGMDDHVFREDGLMFASNTGKIQTKMLTSVERTQLLMACGFNFKGGSISDKTNLCNRTTIIGTTPSGFWDTMLSSRNLMGNDTKKFVK